MAYMNEYTEYIYTPNEYINRIETLIEYFYFTFYM